jgi:hypothetical protein
MEWIFALGVLALMIFVPAFRYIAMAAAVSIFVLSEMADTRQRNEQRIERMNAHKTNCLTNVYAKFVEDCSDVLAGK